MRVLITGASKGIGRAIALEIAQDCSALVLLARSEDCLRELGNELKAKNPRCKVIIKVADASEPSVIHECFETITSLLRGLDVLVNCAGKAIAPTAIQEVSLETWEEIFRVNATVPFLMTQAAIPAMRGSAHPTILNVASTAGLSPRPGWSAYAASKAALVSLSITMAEELKPYGIKVHCIAPGRTATELRRTLAPDEDPSTIMQPEEVAHVVRFLLSPDGKVLHGQAIVVRGE